MELSYIFSIALSAIAVIGFTVYVLQKSKPIKAETKHGVDSETSELVSDLANAGTGMVNKLADTVRHVTEQTAKVTEITLGPIARGAGEILLSVTDRIKVRQGEFNTLKTESIALAQEIERLRNRQIDVTSVTAQLKLGLISVSQQYTSWIKKEIDSEAGGVTTQSNRTEYAGLHQAKYITQVGVDIDQLRFELNTDNRIMVLGLRNAEILGIKDLRIEPLLDEIRKFTNEGIFRSARAEILQDDSRLNNQVEAHRGQLLKEIQDNQSIAHLVEPNAKFALAFLKACLSAGGYQVEESTVPLQNPKRFGELCQEINHRISEQINACTTKQLAIESQSRTIEGVILEIVTENLQENR